MSGVGFKRWGYFYTISVLYVIHQEGSLHTGTGTKVQVRQFAIIFLYTE